MKIQIKAEYSAKEVAEMVVANHVQKFGKAPDGDQWTAEERYGKYVVENEPIPEPEPAPIPAEAGKTVEAPAVNPF